MSSACKFEKAWIGPCGKECEADFCKEHLQVKCCVCGKQAKRECSYCGQFVCGYPLCDDCEDYAIPNTGSGAWGFMNHAHRPKQSTI